MNNKFIIYLLVMFLVTYLIRFLPLLLIRKKIENKFFRAFLTYIPYTVLGSMTFPAIFHSVNNIAAGVSGAVVALILAFCKQGLCVVAAGASAAVYIAMLILM